MSFQALEIARTALAASRAAIDISSQNVANANTPGYVRQRAVLTPVASTTSDPSVTTGIGVTVETVERLRDQCLEAQINHQQGQYGREKAQADSLSRVENYFPDLSDTGIAASLEGVFDALQELQTVPSSTTAREEVVFSAEGFCQQMCSAVAKLQEERATLESDLSQQVDRANQLLTQVAQLNGKIMTLGDSPTANDLKVTREEAIRELAGICGASGLDQANGSQDVLLGGIRLVQGTEPKQLSLIQDPTDPAKHIVAVGDIVSPEALAGKIAGDITARDNNLSEWEDQLNTLARDFADAFNAQHESGYDLNNDAGEAFFTYTAGHEASTLAVSQAIVDDPSKLAVASVSGGAPGDGSNAAALANLRDQKTIAGGAETAEDFYTAILHSIASETNHASESAEARGGLVSSLETEYANESGVSLDEEAVDLMRYQQMYNAAAQIVQMAGEMMDTLLQMAG